MIRVALFSLTSENHLNVTVHGVAGGTAVTIPSMLLAENSFIDFGIDSIASLNIAVGTGSESHSAPSNGSLRVFPPGATYTTLWSNNTGTSNLVVILDNSIVIE